MVQHMIAEAFIGPRRGPGPARAAQALRRQAIMVALIRFTHTTIYLT